MEFFRTRKRKKAIESYLRELPALLAKDYGRTKIYTPKQVRSTAERGGLPLVFVCFGIAMFSEKFEFDDYHQEIGEQCDYDSMRSEIGNTCFNGNSDFDVTEIHLASSVIGGGFEIGGYPGGDSGGFSGSDGGGGSD